MNHSEQTLTSPLSASATTSAPLLGLTIAWHPDMDRIGEQFISSDGGGELSLNRELALNRYLPLFAKPGKEGLGLGHGGISREPVYIVRNSADELEIRLPASRMVVEINGTQIVGPTRVSREQVERGVILALGRTVLICLHWMRCLPKNNAVPGFLGVGSAAIRTRDLIRQAAASDAPVLLLGETGTGKEVAACAIHALGKRATAPFVTVNMAALNESLAAADLFGAAKGAYTGAHSARDGFFAEAENATLFLDEIGNTPANVQPMLLRVLQNGEYRALGAQGVRYSTARLITATDQDLYGGGFNQALLRRLEGFVIPVPPLRTRREDIGVLMANLLREAASNGEPVATLPTPLISEFLNHDWPGNVRQLAHALKRAVTAQRVGETPIFQTLVDLPTRGPANKVVSEHESPGAVAPKPVPAARKKLADITPTDVLDAMHRSRWEIQGAAEWLGISRPSMYKLLDEHPDIRRPEQIDRDELGRTLAANAGDWARSAAALKTPAEALRRHLRSLGLLVLDE